MNPTLYNSLILAGVFQGLIFGCTILISPKYKTRSVRYLAYLIISFSLGIFQFTLEESGILTHDQLFEYYHVPWSVLVAPCLYFYVITFLYPQKNTTLKERLLFLPFFAMLLVSTLYKIMAQINPTDPQIAGALYRIPFLGNYYGDLINALFIFFIIVVLFRRIYSYEIENSQYNPEQFKIKLKWLKTTLYVLLFLITFLVYTTLRYQSDTNVIFFPLYLAIAMTIYWLGYIGIYKSAIVEERKKIRTFTKDNKTFSIVEKQKNEHIAALESLLIDERKFLDNRISLEHLAEELNISKGHLSRVINAELNTSFSDYVNMLRVEEAKSYLKNPEFSNYTLVAIGLEAGFNSKSTFNNAFKKHTGRTPSQYKTQS